MALDRSKFNDSLERLRGNIIDLSEGYEDDVDDLMIEAALRGESFMKKNAPWDDNDGNRDRKPGAARRGLFTVPDIGGDHKEIIFSHGVDHGIWLETKHSGRDQIIMPTVLAIGEGLMESLEESINVKRGFIGAVGEAKGESGIVREHDRRR